MLGPEPTLIIQAIVAALSAANIAVATQTGVPSWVSIVISVLIPALGALVNRSQVTPNQKAAAAVAAARPSIGANVTPPAATEPAGDLEQGPDPVPEDLNSEAWLANRDPDQGEKS